MRRGTHERRHAIISSLGKEQLKATIKIIIIMLTLKEHGFYYQVQRYTAGTFCMYTDTAQTSIVKPAQGFMH
jgi:hypothetical protein